MARIFRLGRSSGCDLAGQQKNQPPDQESNQLDYSKHTSRVFGPPGQNEGDDDRYDVECDLCGWIAAADTVEEAAAIAKLHEKFVATLVAAWSFE